MARRPIRSRYLIADPIDDTLPLLGWPEADDRPMLMAEQPTELFCMDCQR
jgi:hypothetical protein